VREQTTRRTYSKHFLTLPPRNSPPFPVPIVVASLRNAPAEQYAACRVIEAISIVLGGGNDSFYELCEPNLKRAVMATGNQPQVRAAALRAMSLAAFVCSTDFSSTVVLLDMCEAASSERYRGGEEGGGRSEEGGARREERGGRSEIKLSKDLNSSLRSSRPLLLVL
jgi:hypothetical protein